MTMQIKKLVSLPSRSGRHLQRYNQGFRQVVGCIPYRIRNKSSLILGPSLDDLEVLLISSQKSARLMFPKGGWELDEDIELAASRETLEEAGVIGLLGEKLGEWIFKSKSQEKFHEGSMFAMFVTEELDIWPEKNVRQRVWMTVKEAREACAASWMKEALDEFVCRFTCSQTMAMEEEPLTSCLLAMLGGDDLTFSDGDQDSTFSDGDQTTDGDQDSAFSDGDQTTDEEDNVCYLIS